MFSDWQGWSSDTFFYNNIFYVDGTAQFSFGLSRNPDGAYVTAPGTGQSTNNIFDSNLYFGNVKLPQDIHALTVDPQFVAIGQGRIGRETLEGYRLRPGSPAIASAMQIPNAGDHDFWLAPLPQAGPRDRGASQSPPQQKR